MSLKIDQKVDFLECRENQFLHQCQGWKISCRRVILLQKDSCLQFFVRFWWHFFRFLPILAVFRQNGITFSARSTTFVRMLMDFVENSNNYKYIPFRCNHYFHITIIVPLIPEPRTLHTDIMDFFKNILLFLVVIRKDLGILGYACFITMARTGRKSWYLRIFWYQHQSYPTRIKGDLAS